MTVYVRVGSRLVETEVTVVGTNSVDTEVSVETEVTVLVAVVVTVAGCQLSFNRKTSRLPAYVSLPLGVSVAPAGVPSANVGAPRLAPGVPTVPDGTVTVP